MVIHYEHGRTHILIVLYAIPANIVAGTNVFSFHFGVTSQSCWKS